MNETTLNALRRYVHDLYGPEARTARVCTRHHSNGALLSMYVQVWDEQETLYPDIHLPYWNRVARETDTFEACTTLAQEQMAADAYLLKCQVPQEYGIPTEPTEEIDLESGLPVTHLRMISAHPQYTHQTRILSHR